MKRNLLYVTLFSALALTACKKVSQQEPTETLEVEEKNSVVIAKHTWTGCGPCGGWGFTTFQNLLDNNPDEVHMAFKRGNVGGYDNQAIYDFFKSTFDIQGGTPTFHYNLDETSSLSNAKNQMDAQGVIANANYEMEIQGDKIILKTTTKFFQEIQGTFRLAPYLIVDNLIANQAGHPDGANTAHKKVPVDIARPVGAATSNYAGYVIADGTVKDGYTVNLECEVDIDPSWDPADISFALLIFRDQGNDSYGLINAFTK